MYHLGTSKGQNRPSASARVTSRAARATARDRAHPQHRRGGRPRLHAADGRVNDCNNPYAARYVRRRATATPDHSARTWIKAWKRVYLIMHGGDVAAIDAKLAGLGLPAVQAGAATLPAAQIAFVWAPMTGGAPNISALAPAPSTGPGAGGSTGSARASTRASPTSPGWTASTRTSRSASASRSRSPSGRSGAGTPRGSPTHLFGWIASHKRVEWSSTTRAGEAGGIFRLGHYPASASMMRERLGHPRYLGFAPEHQLAGYGARVAAMTRR